VQCFLQRDKKGHTVSVCKTPYELFRGGTKYNRSLHCLQCVEEVVKLLCNIKNGCLKTLPSPNTILLSDTL
jgi:hypothetical protein